ncbi:VanZ family protein [Leucobacter sp. W1153]|uniref:VanZ family protein n=1 Tax=Leucobacter sp. W1153 TaxID=3439064 RepID=UPI003F33CEAA
MTTTSTAARFSAITWIARALLAAFGVVLALIVLLPSEGHRVLGLVETLAGIATRAGISYQLAFATLEFGANIALFVPLGLLVPIAFASSPGSGIRGIAPATLFGTVCVGAATSVLIELAQQVIPGRVSSPADVLANTMGTALGVLLLIALRRGFVSGSRQAHTR